MRVIPCLLLQDGSLVKTVKFKEPSYIGDPINVVRIFNEKEVDELIFLDIAATPSNKRPPMRILSEIASECFMPITFGGGIRDLDDIRAIFNLGIEKVAINSFAVENPGFISEAAKRFGSQSIVASIDFKTKRFGGQVVVSHGGKNMTRWDPAEYAVTLERLGAGEILLTSIDKDGTQQGYDVAMLKKVSEAVRIPVISCGGAGNVDDFAVAVRQGGASACAAGSMFVYYGRNRAVLVNFPSRRELDDALGELEI